MIIRKRKKMSAKKIITRIKKIRNFSIAIIKIVNLTYN